MKSIRLYQIAFGAALLLAVLIAFLFEKGVLPTGVVPTGSSLQYTLDVLCVVLCMAGTYFALRLLAFQKTKTHIRRDGLSAYLRYAGLRIALVAVCVVVETATYFLTLQSQTAHYALFISLVAAVFCIPSQREFDSIVSPNK